VGGEVAIGSYLINFLGLPEIAGMKEADAAAYVPYYWGGAMVGRFIGSFLLTRVKPGLLLAAQAGMAFLLVGISVVSTGSTAMWSVILVGLMNSIMFATIFTLAIKDLGVLTNKGGSLLNMAIVGGAVVPYVQGLYADSIGLHQAFIIPLACYAYIVYYGLSGSKVRTA
jgi:FHS family L-fucose permease-like MFS transporter